MRGAAEPLRSEKLKSLLSAAMLGEPDAAGRDPDVLFDNELDRVSGLPGPRPNLPLLKALGAEVGARGAEADAYVEVLCAARKMARVFIGFFALAHRATRGSERGARPHDPSAVLLLEHAEDVQNERRMALVAALEDVLAARGEEALTLLLPHADGYLHLHVLLEAATTSRALQALKTETTLLAAVEAAYAMIVDAPRAAERSQGYRTLRDALPAQIARAEKRFVGLARWLQDKASTAENPQGRALLDETIKRLRPQVGDAGAAKLRATFEASAKPDRDAARIVAGTRKRSRGRS